MASSTSSKSCYRCPKGEGQVICGGCQHWFCIKHLLDHRQEFSQQMDQLTLEHDQLQQNLTANDNDRSNPLISRVDRWETKSIQKIKQIADEVRQQLRNSLGQSKKKVERSLRTITHELQENRQREAFAEIHLAKWMTQLKDLKNNWNNYR